MDLHKLKDPFPVNLISWRVGATNAKKNGGKATSGIALAYIDARDVMERLDTVCGIENYQVLHPHANGKTSCRIGIKIKDEWIWKENGAGDSAMDAEKGAFSDSFKRAAVLWGVGRYLYDVPNIWVDLDDWGKIKNPADPRLMKALVEAAKGIRGQHEPPPAVTETEPSVFNDADDVKNFLLSAKSEIEKCSSPQEIINWENYNTRKLDFLKPKQKGAIEDLLASQRLKTQAQLGTRQ